MKIFLSYSHKDKAQADAIDNFFISKKITLIRDVRDLKFKQNIKSFMKTVNEADKIITIISSSYLTSHNCMFEAVELINDDNYLNKIIPVVLPEAKIHEFEKRLEYVAFWNTRIEQIKKKIADNIDVVQSVNNIYDEIRYYATIRNSIYNFITSINDIVYHLYVNPTEQFFHTLMEECFPNQTIDSIVGDLYKKSYPVGAIADLIGIRKDLIKESLSNFHNIEHRLELLGDVRGVVFINDSKATNVNSTWYSLESMSNPVILILGGVDKGNNYSILNDLVKTKVKAIICLGADNKKIIKAFGGMVETILEANSAKEAVAQAYRLGKKGDTVLLSPACASFDLFEDYEDRGRQFRKAVRTLQIT